MSKFTGIVTKSDLEGGFWTLDAGGTQYQLQGATSGLVEGQAVEIEGEVETATMGIGMMGSILRVDRWK